MAVTRTSHNEFRTFSCISFGVVAVSRVLRASKQDTEPQTGLTYITNAPKTLNDKEKEEGDDWEGRRRA